MKPLLAHVYEPHRVTYPCYVQPKLNGVRALYQNGCFQSRDQLPWSAGILDHISRELVDVVDSRTILDGELYVHGWPLQRINGAVTPIRQSQRVDTALVEYHVFDSVAFHQTFEERWNALPHGIAGARVSFVETIRVVTHIEANALYAKWVEEGYEGMMYRLGDCPYTTPKQKWDELHRSGIENFRRGLTRPKSGFLSDKDNRCWHLLKRKSWQDREFKCVDYTRTVGEKGEPGFQLTCILPNGKTFNVGSGLSHTEQDFYEVNPPIDRMVKVQYLTLSEDGIPQNNTLLAIL